MMFVPFGTAISRPSILTVIRSGLGGAIMVGLDQRLRRLLAGGLHLGVLLEFLAELGDEALGRPGAGLAEGADRAAGDLVGHALQEFAVLGAGVAVDHPGRDPLHPERALAAWRALAAALVGVE